MDDSKVFKLAVKWIENNTLENAGISVSSSVGRPYPEVTGYFIPSLLKWGETDRALSYAKWLISIQRDDGSWYDSDNHSPYTFDSAQVLKGLLAIYPMFPEAKNSILKGCDWIVSNIDQHGRLTTPSISSWGADGVCSELVHLYCLSPLVQASELFNFPAYQEAAKKVLNYYKSHFNHEIINFNILSHFYAYIIEALVDLNEIDLAKKAMKNVKELQRPDGSIPAYRDVEWVCSTGIFQFSLIWYKLGELEAADKSFRYACSLQNPSGGWYGSYTWGKKIILPFGRRKPNYFPNTEISWAIKYFLDGYTHFLRRNES